MYSLRHILISAFFFLLTGFVMANFFLIGPVTHFGYNPGYNLYFVESSIGGSLHLYCSKLIYSGADGVFDCETDSVGGFNWAGISIDENTLSPIAIKCLLEKDLNG